ncbi:MAG: hypothetical protein SGI92_27220 [Bryobacteraceae bacterium]|nr:hypothetical protein [Bryobacteraceae bacterium]
MALDKPLSSDNAAAIAFLKKGQLRGARPSELLLSLPVGVAAAMLPGLDLSDDR